MAFLGHPAPGNFADVYFKAPGDRRHSFNSDLELLSFSVQSIGKKSG